MDHGANNWPHITGAMQLKACVALHEQPCIEVLLLQPLLQGL